MKYLKKLIANLDAEQYESLLTMPLTNTEKKLINFYRERNTSLDDVSLAESLSIKESTLKKIQSKLINEVLSFFSLSDNLMDKLDFLSKNNSHRLLMHIAKKEMKLLEKSKNYKLLSELCFNTPFKMLNGLLDSFCLEDIFLFRDKFIALNPTKQYEITKLNIVVLILEGYQFNPKKDDIVDYKKRIDLINTEKNLVLEFWKNKLLGDYFNITCEYDKYLDCIKKNYLLTQGNLSKFSKENIVSSELIYSFYLVEHNKFQEAYDLLQKVFERKTYEIKKGMRYVDLFSQLCIVLGKYEEARKTILDNYPINNAKPGKFAEIYFGSTTILAIIDILENKMEDAFEKISVAKIGLKKQYFIYLDSLLRLVEQAYFYKTKNYSLADSFYQKNMKFYQYHDLEDLIAMKNGHKVIHYYYKMNFNKRNSTKCQQYIKDLNQGELAFVGHFLEKLGQKG